MGDDLGVFREAYLKCSVDVDTQLRQFALAFFIDFFRCDGYHTILVSTHRKNIEHMHWLTSLFCSLNLKFISTIAFVDDLPYIGILG